MLWLMRSLVFPFELTLPVDERMEEARQRKKDKCQGLVKEVSAHGFQVLEQLKLDQGSA